MLILLFSEFANVAGFASWNKSPDPYLTRVVDQTKNKNPLQHCARTGFVPV